MAALLRQAQSTTQPLAGGGQAVLLSGQIERAASVTALVTGEELVALRDRVGDVGTLVLGPGRTAACCWNAVSKPAELGAHGVYEVDLDFVLGIDQVDTIVCSVNVNGLRVRDVLNVQVSYGRARASRRRRSTA